jgi:hypothetical protein
VLAPASRILGRRRSSFRLDREDVAATERERAARSSPGSARSARVPASGRSRHSASSTLVDAVALQSSSSILPGPIVIR